MGNDQTLLLPSASYSFYIYQGLRVSSDPFVLLGLLFYHSLVFFSRPSFPLYQCPHSFSMPSASSHTAPHPPFVT